MTGHIYFPWEWVASSAWWGTLSKENQNIITDAVETARKYGSSIEDEKDKFNSFSLLSIPFFVFAATIMNTGSTTNRIFSFADSVVGHFRGGLGHVNVVASMIFAGMSGTAVADAAGLGKLGIKAMTDAGYDLKFSTGITGASSVIGPIIPPSVGMIIYGWLSDVSIGCLFIGAIIPGVLMGLFMMIMVYLWAYKEKMPRRPKATLKDIFNYSKAAFLPLLTPVIIVGGIWSGIFSPTESGVMASIYAILLGMVVYRDVSFKQLLQTFKTTIELEAYKQLLLTYY